MLPRTTNLNPQPIPAPTCHTPSGAASALPHLEESPRRLTSLAALGPLDRDKLSLLFRTRGDAVSFAALREEDPLETLVWLSQPHIKPWHELIQAAHREHEQTETRLALARALKDITRILDLEADSTLRIRAVNAIIRLANAIHRSGSPRTAPSSPLKGASDGCRRVAEAPQGSRGSASAPPVTALLNPPHPSGVREPTELHRAADNAEAAALHLKLHLDRRALRDDELQDAKAPRGTPPTPLPDPRINRLGSLDRTVDTPPIAILAPTGAPNLTVHLNGKHPTAKAGTPRPPPDRRRPRKRRR
jgi:hypothetical protein